MSTTNPYVRDPQCGGVVARKEAVPAFEDGRTLFFYSRFCRLRYARRRERQPRRYPAKHPVVSPRAAGGCSNARLPLLKMASWCGEDRGSS